VRPHVLLVFLTRFEDCMNMLKGIAHYERTHQLWTAFHDDQARAETDPHWLKTQAAAPGGKGLGDLPGAVRVP
jgi:LacI family transcriptional regulator